MGSFVVGQWPMVTQEVVHDSWIMSYSNLTHLFVFSRLIINTGGIHIEKHYIRCEILTTLRHFESNLIYISFLINYPFSLFLSSFSFHSFNLACRNPSCTHSIPGQRPDRWFLRKKIIHLCVIALALDTNAKIIMMKTTKRARTTPLAMIASLPSNISTEDLKNISPGGPPVRKMATEEGWYGMVFLGP